MSAQNLELDNFYYDRINNILLKNSHTITMMGFG